MNETTSSNLARVARQVLAATAWSRSAEDLLPVLEELTEAVTDLVLDIEAALDDAFEKESDILRPVLLGWAGDLPGGVPNDLAGLGAS